MSALRESALVVLGPFLLFALGVGVLDRFGAELGRRPTTIRIEPGSAAPDSWDEAYELDEPPPDREDEAAPSEAHARALERAPRLSDREALDELERVLVDEGPSVRLLADVGAAALRAGRAPRAVEVLEQAARLGDVGPRTLYRLSVARSRVGDIDGAMRSYRSVLELQPTHQAAQINLGALQLDSGDARGAVRTLERAVELSGARLKPRALYTLGQAWLALDEPARAAASFERAIQYRPGHAEAWLRLGDARRALAESAARQDGPESSRSDRSETTARDASPATVGEGSTDDSSEPRSSRSALIADAEAAYRSAISLVPAFTAAHAALARLQLADGRTDDAIDVLRAAVAADPASLDARELLARLLEDEGRVREARPHYEWIASQQSGTPRSLLSRGNVAAMDGDLEQAEALYREALEASRGRLADAHARLAATLRRREAYEEALEVDRRFVREFPGDARGRLGLASDMLALGRNASAQREIERLLEDEPESPDGWFMLGRLHAERDEPKRAIAAYQRAIELRPEGRSALLNLAVLEARDGDDEGAITLYQRILEREPNYAPALFNLALALTRQEDIDEAASVYERLLAVDASHNGGRLNLAVLERRRGNDDRAEELLREALLREPADVRARYNLALLLDRTSRPREALRELRRIVALDPAFVKGWKSLGRLLDSLESWDEAAAAYERALALDPDSNLARRGLERARRATGGNAR